MPKTPSRSAKAQEDEGRVLEAIRRQPEIIESLNQIFTTGSGRKKQIMSQCEEFAERLNCSAELLKKVWLQVRQNGETKKTDSSESRPKSARSSSTEPRETRRSLRSQSIDKTILDSADSSCSSSLCGSPRPTSKQQQQQQRSSRRNLSAISENDMNSNASAAAAADSNQQEEPDSKESEEPRSLSEAMTKAWLKSRQTTEAKNRRSKVAEKTVSVATGTTSERECKEDARDEEDSDTTIRNLGEDVEIIDEKRPFALPFARLTEDSKQYCSQRFSEPMLTPRNSQSSSNGFRRMPVATSTKETKPASLKKTLPNPEEPTRVFFESMALTVLNFPQHVQASLKARISAIVYDVEYDLSSPSSSVFDKPVAVAS